jgi:membrane protein DedA with SNARE-associated domain
MGRTLPARRRGVVSFLTVGFQTLINLAAGVTRMSLRHYLPAVVVGSVMWAFVYATIGFVGSPRSRACTPGRRSSR